MANQPYFPGREGDQLTFLTNLQSKIAAYYTALDISAARQPKLQLTLAWLIWAWQSYLPARRQDAPAATSWRNLLATGTSDATTVTAPPAPAVLTPPAGTAYFGMLTCFSRKSAAGRPPKATPTPSARTSASSVPPPPRTPTRPSSARGPWRKTTSSSTSPSTSTTASGSKTRSRAPPGSPSSPPTPPPPYNDTRPVKTPGQAEWRDYRACWWDNATASMAFGPVLRVLVQG